MSALAKQRLTAAEYLALERAAEVKSELLGGEIFAMAGASRAHSLIVVNVASGLVPQLRGRPCEVHVTDMRVKVNAIGLYTYPDVVVVCGEPAFEDAHLDTLLNPTLIIEVLSPSTEAYDRGGKFAHYRRLESLREYVLIAQDEVRVERFVRQPDQQWLFSEAADLEQTMPLAAIGCELALAQVYERVEFAGAAGAE